MKRIPTKQITDERRQDIYECMEICRQMGADLATRVYAEDVEALLAHISYLERLATTEALKPLGICQVIDHAVDALGGRANAIQWLDTPHPKLSGRRPLDFLLRTPYDVQKVDDLLTELRKRAYPTEQARSSPE